MLPVTNSQRPSLADVLPSCLDSLLARPNPLSLPPVERAVVFVVDGLGVNAVTERAGHARTLAGALSKSALSKSAMATSGFPTTTASGLATITTGTLPGVHGMVGYTALDPENDRVVQLLTGWDDKLDPLTWQRSRTVFERAADDGIPSFAIGVERFRNSGFTSAVLRGADYRSGASVGQRVDEARRVLDSHDHALVYVYAAEVDHAAHNYGRQSRQWLTALESVDAAAASLTSSLGPREGMLLTADHGSLDVPRHAHVFFDHEPGLLDGIRHIAGEPRALQLHFEPDAGEGHRERILQRWRASEGGRSQVLTRAEAIADGWFGPSVDPVVERRIGDIIVATRKGIAYYDSRSADSKAQAMIGQHGSLSPDETRVPLLRFGAFALSAVTR